MEPRPHRSAEHFASAWAERGNHREQFKRASVGFAGFSAWVYGYDLHVKAAKRKSLRESDFVYPPGSRIGGSQGRYPIDTKKRARAALRYSRPSRYGRHLPDCVEQGPQALPQFE